MRTWELIRLALEALRRTPLRAGLTILGVSIACGSLVSMVAFALGLQQQAERPFTRLELFNQIEVFPANPAGTNTPAILDAAALEQIGKLPGVVTAYPNLRVTGLKVRHGDHEQTTMAMALPRDVGLLSLVQEMVSVGRFFAVGSEPEALISTRLADELGFAGAAAAVGQEITLEASGLSPGDADTFQFERRVFPARIVGVFAIPGMAPGFLQRGVLLPVDVVQSIPGVQFQASLDRLRTGGDPDRSGYTQAIVRVLHPRDVPRAKQAIEAMGYRTRALIDQLREMRTFFILLDLLLAAVGTVALVVASLGIINTLLIAVLERTQEIGLCKALGASEGDLRVLFMTEAAWVGVWGGAGGLALGWGVAKILDLAARIYTQRVGVPLESSLFAFPAWLLLGTVLFAMLVSIVAGLLPANRAARVDPIRALRGL